MRLQIGQLERVRKIHFRQRRRIERHREPRLPMVVGTQRDQAPPGVIFDGGRLRLAEPDAGVEPRVRATDGLLQITPLEVAVFQMKGPDTGDGEPSR